MNETDYKKACVVLRMMATNADVQRALYQGGHRRESIDDAVAIAEEMCNPQDHSLVSDDDEVSVEMLLWCPLCHTRHIDEGEFTSKPHSTHACQNPKCGLVWKPAKVPTVGVWQLPGYGGES